MNDQAWIIIGYETKKPKKPHRIDKLHFGRSMGKGEAFTAAQHIFWNHSVTEVIESRWTRWDIIKEWLHDEEWLWVSALLVGAGVMLALYLNHTVGLMMIVIGIAYGVAAIPKSEF